MTAKSRINAVMFADGKMVTAKSDISAVTVNVRMDMTANCRHIDFQVVNVTAFCRHNALPLSPNGVPAPFQRRCLAHSSVSGGFGGVSHSDGHSVVRRKKRSRHIDTPTQAGEFPRCGSCTVVAM